LGDDLQARVQRAAVAISAAAGKRSVMPGVLLIPMVAVPVWLLCALIGIVIAFGSGALTIFAPSPAKR